jgi:H+/Cl- antiporter ClcA
MSSNTSPAPEPLLSPGAGVPWWQGLLLALPAAILAGSASALFLWALQQITELHWQHPQLLYGLPLAGILIGWIYQRWGSTAEAGNNLIIREIHQPQSGVPGRMSVLVLIGTLITHLFGGSAGREGTAVQMGGSLAGWAGRRLRLGPSRQRLILLCGVAAGFGSIFATPLAGAVFAIEFLTVGRIYFRSLLPVLAASFLGDWVCHLWGAHHSSYTIDSTLTFSTLAAFWLLFKVLVTGISCGLAARLFSSLTHFFQRQFQHWIPQKTLRPLVGGLIIIGLVWMLGSRDYLGLGVQAAPGGQVSIENSFHPQGATPLSWLWKTLFTSITLSSGFKGGEVTPLFFIGSTLGNQLGQLMNAPISLFAALGFIAVFAGAAKTPLACTLMGIELFGHTYSPYFALVCYTAFLASGSSGIYSAQQKRPPRAHKKTLG